MKTRKNARAAKPAKRRLPLNEASVDRFINYVLGVLLGAMIISALYH